MWMTSCASLLSSSHRFVLQAEAARKAKDWTVGMAAYDQVLAKLKNVGSPPASNPALPEVGKTKKRKQTVVCALRPKSGTKKLKSSKEECVPALDVTANNEETAVLEDSGSHAEATAKVDIAIAARASHLARFGRRRAGKNVRRYATRFCATAASAILCAALSGVHLIHLQSVDGSREVKGGVTRVCLCSYSGSDLAAILGENSMAVPGASESKPPEEGARRLVVDLRESMQLSTLQGNAQAASCLPYYCASLSQLSSAGSWVVFAGRAACCHDTGLHAWAIRDLPLYFITHGLVGCCQIAKRSSRRSLAMSRGGGTAPSRGLAAWVAVLRSPSRHHAQNPR